MDKFLLALAALSCPIGMGAMMWWMAKGMRRKPESPAAEQPADVDDLREEHRRLGAEIERLEQGASAEENDLSRSAR